MNKSRIFRYAHQLAKGYGKEYFPEWTYQQVFSYFLRQEWDMEKNLVRQRELFADVVNA